MSTFGEVYDNLWKNIERLPRFRARWMTFDAFKKHIDRMETHFSSYKEIFLMGHFSNSFARQVKGLCSRLPGCDFRVLSIDPGKNQKNLDALQKIKDDGAKVRIHKTLHARLFIGYNKDTDTMMVIIGTYDYNREGISGENINVGIYSHDSELVLRARTFFLEQWDSADAYDI